MKTTFQPVRRIELKQIKGGGKIVAARCLGVCQTDEQCDPNHLYACVCVPHGAAGSRCVPL